jgi:ribosomal protein S14
MYEFLDRLISLVLPRVRDFRGLKPNAFDGNGNYSLGLTEQLVFPELNPDKYTRVQGMNIAIVCSSHSNDEAEREILWLPFQRKVRRLTIFSRRGKETCKRIQDRQNGKPDSGAQASRCNLCGRPHTVYRNFAVRIHFASWRIRQDSRRADGELVREV